MALPRRLAASAWAAGLVLTCCAEPSPVERAAREIEDIVARAELRPLCGDPHERALRAVGGELPPCAERVTHAYVVAHTDRGPLVVIAAVGRA